MGTNTKATTKRTRSRQHNVFCLEGDWSHIRDKATIEPALELLKSNGEFAFDYIHRDVGVVAELEYYLQKWVQSGLMRYPILYLAFHGNPGRIVVGDARRRESRVTLEWLAAQLEGRCKNKLIHFGSCGTLDVHGQSLNSFLRRTEALAICGYRTNTEWFESLAFEIMLLAKLQEVDWSRRGMAAVQRWLKKQAGGMVRSLKFRLVVSKRK